MSAAASPNSLSLRQAGMLAVLCGELFLAGMDASMINVALPSIANDLRMSTSSSQWLISGYVLGYGGFLLLGGRAADLLGRRRVFLIGLAVFVVASGLGGLAQDGLILIAARFVKGVAAAFVAPAGLSIITTSFAEGRKRNRALAIYAGTGATGFGLGLVFGGLLTGLGWRWVLFFPVPVALGILLGAILLIPRPDSHRRHIGRFDIAGAVTAPAAILLLVYTVVSAPEAGWGSLRTLGGLMGACLLLAIFLTVERRAAKPLVPFAIFRSGDLVRANIGAMMLLGSWFCVFFLATLYMQDLREWSALQTGFAVLPTALVNVACTPLTPRLIERFGTGPVILSGMCCCLAGFLVFLNVQADSAYIEILFPAFVLSGIGFGLAYGPLNVAATNGVGAGDQGLASGLVNTSLQLGGALILAIGTAVNASAIGSGTSGVLAGYHAATVVSIMAILVGIIVTATGLGGRRALARVRAAPVSPDETAVDLADGAEQGLLAGCSSDS